jgi:hypothetical protein
VFIRDLPFNLIIGTPARNTVNNTKIGASISRRLVTNMADTPRRKAPKHINPLKIQQWVVFSTHLDQHFSSVVRVLGGDG